MDIFNIIKKIWEFIVSLIGNAGEFLKIAEDMAGVENHGLSDIVSCISASVNLIMPLDTILLCFTIQIPIFITSTVIKLILRIKSFIPTMGGK